MAIQKLFIENINTEWKKLGNSMNTEYIYNGKELGIKWKDKIKKYPAKIGDAFAINCNGTFPKVTPLTPPKRKGEKLLWLASFPKRARVQREEDIESFVESVREHYDWWGYREFRNHEPGKWYLVLCNRPDFGGVHHVAGWVSDDLSNDEVKEFIERYKKFRGFYFPEWYVEKFIKEELHM